MITTRRVSFTLGVLGLALGACSDRRPVDDSLSVVVAPVELTEYGQIPIVDVVYTLSVVTDEGQGELVWEQEVHADDYGHGPSGALTYVGPCPASDIPVRVYLVLDAMLSASGPIAASFYANPAPPDDPDTTEDERIYQDVLCEPNKDKRVDFNLTVLRSGGQGFFDVAVTFDDIFCAAKLECKDDLLTYPAGHAREGQRGSAAILGFACTSNEEATSLYLSRIRITCEGLAEPILISPAGTHRPPRAGGQGPIALPPAPADPLVYEHGIYWALEAMTDFQKCFWNFAIGIDEAVLGTLGRCTLTARGTASESDWADSVTPADTAWPLIEWNVALNYDPADTSGSSAPDLTCGEHSVNQPGSGVQTAYTAPAAPVRFPAVMDHCEPPDLEEVQCVGAVGGSADALVVTPVGAGSAQVTIGGVQSEVLALPADAQLGAACCVEPCCDTTPTNTSPSIP
ncbi:MAG: hypothetical protein IT385_18450 [Deltaproteobacteria bacterium]|nr:hypothetical protein [Deltaproteobacteria bacterium]